jgi:hypothetical protein
LGRRKLVQQRLLACGIVFVERLHLQLHARFLFFLKRLWVCLYACFLELQRLRLFLRSRFLELQRLLSGVFFEQRLLSRQQLLQRLVLVFTIPFDIYNGACFSQGTPRFIFNSLLL